MTIPRVCHGWMHGAFGHPSKVLKYTSSPLPDLSSSKLLVRLKGSPVNAADVNMVQGTYPVRPDLSVAPGGMAVAGNEGLWEVCSAGSEVSSKFSKGDWVLPARQGLGLWRDFAIVDASDVIRVPSKTGLSVLNAATVAVNPCTAYRMLQDFVPLSPGEVILQNAANSSVGQSVIQIARLRGLKTVNVIRDRDNFDEVAERLKCLGATLVLPESQVVTPASRKAIAALGPPPRLGLNAVGGPSATNLSRLLGHSGTLVTYGGMSREPLKLATSSLIFSNLQAKGFWLSAWNGSASLDERVQMITEILGWMSQKEFKSPELSTTPLKDMDWSNWDWTAPKTLLVSPPA